MKKILVICVVLLFSCSLQAQESNQLRVLTHVRYFVTSKSPDQGMFIVGWSPINIASNASDNTNLILGVGYSSKNKKWSIENMIWKQWSQAGNSFSLDWRFTYKPTKRVNLYLEEAPRLDEKGLYDFAVVDMKVFGPINVGFETENTHRVGRDTFGFGSRVSVQFPFKFLGGKPVIAVSRQFRTLGPNTTRLYIFFNWSF